MSKSAKSLQDFLEEQEETEQEGFTVTDDSSANWALRKIAYYKQQQKEQAALAQAEKEKVDAWLQGEHKKAQDSIDFFQGLLAPYALQKREAEPKKKSWKLPNGVLKFRKQQPKWNFNEDQLLDYLSKAGKEDLIKVKYSADTAGLKKKFIVAGDKAVDPETGEAIAGISIEHREDAFQVEVDES